MALDPALVAILRCPQCLGALVANVAGDDADAARDAAAGAAAAGAAGGRAGMGSVPALVGFACEGCALLYPVEDDLPNFLVEEALPLGGAHASGGLDGGLASGGGHGTAERREEQTGAR
jgi:uncharacterized protein YbaR (Trm112 family)